MGSKLFRAAQTSSERARGVQTSSKQLRPVQSGSDWFKTAQSSSEQFRVQPVLNSWQQECEDSKELTVMTSRMLRRLWTLSPGWTSFTTGSVPS